MLTVQSLLGLFRHPGERLQNVYESIFEIRVEVQKDITFTGILAIIGKYLCFGYNKGL